MLPSNTEILNRKIEALGNPANTGYANVTRDANQSLFGGAAPSRLAVEAERHAHQVGYASIQVSGGTRLHVPMMKGYNPFEENRIFRAAYPDELLTCLVRGDATFVYKPQPDDVTRELLKQMALSGINGFTVFDGLGDTRQQVFEIEVINQLREEGFPVFAQAGLLIGSAPYMDMDYYKRRAEELMKANPHTFYLKDAVGDSNPEMNARIVEYLRREYNLPQQIHVHYTHGKAQQNLIAAFEAGANILDVVNPALAGNTGHASVLDIHERLKGNPRRPEINTDAVRADIDSASTMRLRYYRTEPAYHKETREAMAGGRAPGGAAGPLRGQFEEHFKNTFGMDWQQSEQLIYAMMKPLLPLLGWPTMVTPHAKNTAAQAAVILLFAVSNDPKFKEAFQAYQTEKLSANFRLVNESDPSEREKIEKALRENSDSKVMAEIILQKFVNDPDFVKAALMKRMTPDITDYLIGKLGAIPGVPDPEVQAAALKKAGLTEVIQDRPANFLAPRMEETRARLIAEGYIIPPVQDETPEEAASRVRKNMPNELVVLAALELPKRDEGHDFAVAAHTGKLAPVAPPELLKHFQPDGRIGPVAGLVMQIAVNAAELQRMYDANDPHQAETIQHLQDENDHLVTVDIPNSLKAAGREKHALGRALQAVNHHLDEVAKTLGVRREFLPKHLDLNFSSYTQNQLIEMCGLDNLATAVERVYAQAERIEEQGMNDFAEAAKQMFSSAAREIAAIQEEIADNLGQAGLLPTQIDAAIRHFSDRVVRDVVRLLGDQQKSVVQVDNELRM